MPTVRAKFLPKPIECPNCSHKFVLNSAATAKLRPSIPGKMTSGRSKVYNTLTMSPTRTLTLSRIVASLEYDDVYVKNCLTWLRKNKYIINESQGVWRAL